MLLSLTWSQHQFVILWQSSKVNFGCCCCCCCKQASKQASKQANDPTPQDLQNVLSMGSRFIKDINSASPPLITSQKDTEDQNSFKKSYPNFDPKIFKMQTEDLSQYLAVQPRRPERDRYLYPSPHSNKKNVIDEIRDSEVISRSIVGSKIAGFTISIREKIQEAVNLLERISNYHFG